MTGNIDAMTIAAPIHPAVPDHLEHRIPTPDGRVLALAEWGDPDGLGLISLHGTPGGRISYWMDPGIYARFGLRRLTYDRPGYGDSTRHVTEVGHMGDDEDVEAQMAWLAGRAARRPLAEGDSSG